MDAMLPIIAHHVDIWALQFVSIRVSGVSSLTVKEVES